MILQLKCPKDSTRKLLVLIRTSRRWQDTKSTQKSVTSLHIDNEDVEEEMIKRQSHPKYQDKQTKTFYNGNFKTLKKDTEEDTRRYQKMQRSWVGRIITMKVIFRFDTILPEFH